MSITYLEAIREAQAKVLRDDKRVFHLRAGRGRGLWWRVQGHQRNWPRNFPGRVLKHAD